MKTKKNPKLKYFLGKKIIQNCLLLTTSLSFSLSSLFFLSNLNNSSLTKENVNLNANNIYESIDDFSDYNLLASSNIIGPVGTNHGVIGFTSTKQTLTLTNYDGILIWSKTIANDQAVVTFYQENYPSATISDLVVNNFVYLEDNEILVVLLGNSNYENQIILGLDINTGVIYQPITKDNEINYILTINDGIKYLFINSNNDVIATKGQTYSDYVNSYYLTFNTINGISSLKFNTSNNIATNQSDYLLTLVAGTNNLNFAIFINATINASGYYDIYLVVVDDYLNPVLNSSNDKINLTFGSYSNLISSSNPIEFDQIFTYQPKLVASSSTSLRFFVATAGSNSSLYLLTYNISSQTISTTATYNASNYGYSIGFFSYDSKTQYLFVANKKATTGYATGYFDLSKTSFSSSSFVGLELSKNRSNWSSSTGIYTNLIKEIPIITDLTLSYTNPYLVLEEGEDPVSKYFVSSTDIQTFEIIFKKYNDPVDRFTSNYSSSLLNLASNVSNSNLINSLVFNTSDNSSFTPTITIANKTSDDENGILTFDYVVTFSNWYTTESSTSSFTIPTTIDGFYATNDFNFSFVTGFTGESSNDDKYTNVLNVKNTTSSVNVTKQQILLYFIEYDIKDINGNNVTISQSDITLTADNSGYTLTVLVNVSGSFPSDVVTSFSYTYNGFLTISGYDYSFIANPGDYDKSQIYPSQLTLTTFLKYFMILGLNWNTDSNSWSFSIVSDDLTGVATVNLSYIGAESSFPSTQNRDLVVNKTITGFLNVPSLFSDINVSINPVYASFMATKLWNDYLNDPTNSKLLNSISFPYVNDNNNLDIVCNNLDTCDDDGYLDLNISIKLDTTTTIYIPNTGNFVYDQAAQDAFIQLLGSYQFNAIWYIYQSNSSFNWVDNNGEIINTDSTNLTIDLTTTSYQNINSSKYASQITENDISSLYIQQDYEITTELKPNDHDGTLNVVLTIKDINDSVGNNYLTKNIIISGFKIPFSKSIRNVIITSAFVCVVILVCVLIIFIIYIKHKKQKFITKNKNK